MFEACMRLIKEVDTHDGSAAARRRCMKRQIVKFSVACLLTIVVLGSVEAGAIYLVMY